MVLRLHGRFGATLACLGVCGVVVTSGCGRREDATSVTAMASAAAKGNSAVAAADSSAAPSKTNAAAGGQDEGCFVNHNEPIRDEGATVSNDPVTGKPTTHVGATLDASARSVTVTELLTKPEAFQGRSVRVEGSVTAMCGHRRAWFAIVDSGSQNPPLRIVTAPAFLVPKDAVGKQARATGTLEIREISEQAAEHQAQEHAMPKDRRIVLLHAAGAEFL